MAYKISDECIGCGACMDACPVGAISEADGKCVISLAEQLRKLPLSFFGKRDLADLTSTIMADCEVLEKDCSHFIPGLFGSLISTMPPAPYVR